MNILKLKKQLEQKLKDKSPHIPFSEVKKIHKKYIDYFHNKKSNEIFVIPMEEMSELNQHLSKIIRGKETVQNLGFLEELADVQISIDNLRIACNIDDETFEYMKDIKLERSSKKLNEGRM